jgi:hypothetical protein
MKVGTSTIAFAISAILIGAAPLVAHAQATAEVARSPGKVEVSQTVKMTATVVAIDLAIRDVTLIDSQGKFHTLNVGDQARNLEQVKVGDKVTIEYTEAISLALKKRGTADPGPPNAQVAMVRSPQGSKPGGAVGRKITAIATVVAINAQKQFVTLRGPQGNEYDVQVVDPAQLKSVVKGDEVEVTYTEALAISVQSAPGPK